MLRNGRNNTPKTVETRINELLNEVSKQQDTQRKEALQKFIHECLYRIDRVCRIKGSSSDLELFKSQFITQLEKAVRNNEFLKHKFHTVSADSSIIDSNDFRNYMLDKMPLFATDGPIVKGEDVAICKAHIEDRISKLERNQNYYIGKALESYIENKIQCLKSRFAIIKLDEASRIDVQTAFVKKLEGFNFSAAYTKCGYENNGVKKFARKTDGFEIDPDSFNEILNKATGFDGTNEGADKFITDILKLTQQQQQFIASIDSIEKEITSYAGENKKNIVDHFKTEMDKIKTDILSVAKIKEVGFFAAAKQAKNKVTELLKDTQVKEDQYYTGLFDPFGWRKANSSLQGKIIDASKTLSQIEIGAHRKRLG